MLNKHPSLNIQARVYYKILYNEKWKLIIEELWIIMANKIQMYFAVKCKQILAVIVYVVNATNDE